MARARSTKSGRSGPGGSGGRAKKPWYADGLQFECTQCGKCCGGEPGYIWVTPEEIHQAAEAQGMHVLDFCQMYVAEYDRGFSLREMDNGDCCLLREGKCTIYAVRPMQCRTWPWWPSNLSSPAAWRDTGRRCPGVGRGRTWSLTEIARQRDRLKI
jgi:Fe-S-cluster containining protein